MTEYLILGAGIAGRRAADAIREQDADGEITLIDEQANPFYARPMLVELLAKGLGAEKIPAKEKNRLAQSGIKLELGARIKELRARDQRVLLDDGRLITFDKLLIASGRQAARLPCDDGQTSGVLYFDRLAQALELSSTLKPSRKVAIFGASYQAMGVLAGLARRGIECSWLLPDARPLPDALDKVGSEILEARLQQEGITLVKNATIHMLEKEQSALQAVIAGNGQRIPADLLIVTAPQEPLSDYLIHSDLASDGGIPVNAKLQSSMDNIYVAGDIARMTSDSSSNAMLQTGWLRAWTQGQIAGSNMAGGSATYDRIPSIRTKALDLDIVCLGESNASGTDITTESGAYPYPEVPYIYKKLVYRNKRMVGAIFLGDVTEAGMVEQWIRKGLTADACDAKVLSQMFDPRFGKSVAHGVLCPVCKFQMQMDESTTEGDIITCPACGLDFKVAKLPNGAYTAISV
jgi:3-phenylpropionate/trans-cinnamate dioxygenase ferredoxin reductase subunit